MRRVECSTCEAAAGRACRSAGGRPTDHHCEWGRWWHWVGVSGTGCWVPGHGDSCGRARCHEVTKRLLFSGWCGVGRLSWGWLFLWFEGQR
ncbi:hypothetical protein [Streptomyces alboniger]|uniref:hypothetical protein n=1 Tax=Streptomyces alboniger TaxID=132473 RepID=UPI003D324D2C